MCDIISRVIKTDVTCVKFIKHHIFAGIGGYLHIYTINPCSLIKKFVIFHNNKIYGIEENESFDKFLIYGANKMKIYTHFSKHEYKERATYTGNDWILCAKWIDNCMMVVVLSAHNELILLSQELHYLKKVICEEHCILYSGLIVNDTWESLIILSGTVFNQILIWQPHCHILKCLKGHNGVIFSISYNKNNGVICSTSDDRSAILWSVENKDLTIELQRNLKIEKKCSVYGHSSRIFRCQVLDNYFITAGEDGVINLWNLDGDFIRKIETAAGNVLWAIHCNEEENIIAVGGSDCSVNLYSISISTQTSRIFPEEEDVPKHIGLLKSGNIILICESGKLKHYKKKNNYIPETVACFENFKSYALLEISPERTQFILAGFQGHINIYDESIETVSLRIKMEIENNPRIFSVHWLTEQSFVICLPKGEMQFWFIWEEPVVMYNFKLPQSREQWSTAACLLQMKYLVVGDRKGNIYLYKLSKNHEEPIQKIVKAHNHLGITSLQSVKTKVISTGRNGIINMYFFNNKSESLMQESCNKTPFMWHAVLKKECSLLLAFSADNFIMWDINLRQTLWEVNCGGGHRSWDFAQSLEKNTLIFIKDKIIHINTCNRKNVHPLELSTSFHIKEINSACCMTNLRSKTTCLMITGGEDTNLRFTTANFIEPFSTLENISNVKSHLSSIRAIKSCEIVCDEQKEVHLLFSAGGRAQVIVWKVQVTHENKKRPNISVSEQCSYYEANDKDQPETRIMDLCYEKLHNCIILYAAGSDGNIKLFSIDTRPGENYTLSYLRKITYAPKCILKILVLSTRNMNYLCSMATDGNIVFWDKKAPQENNITNQDEYLKQNKVINGTEFKPKKIIYAHQSGINSYNYKMINDDMCIFVSGGDDSAIVANVIQFATKDDPKINVLHTVKIINEHCAQVTGIFISETHFITVSIDQKVIVFKWNFINKRKLICKKIKTYITSIPDVQGLQCFKIDPGYNVILHGRGLEILLVQF